MLLEILDKREIISGMLATKQALEECHDIRWAAHLGQERTLTLLEATYYRPCMSDDVEKYVRTCLVGQ